MPRAGNLLHCFPHDIRHDIDAPIIERAPINLLTAMRVTRVKEKKITWIDDIFLILTGQVPLSFFNKTNHIIIVKVIREFLHNPLKTVGFYVKMRAKVQGSDLVLHGMIPSVGGVMVDGLSVHDYWRFLV